MEKGSNYTRAWLDPIKYKVFQTSSLQPTKLVTGKQNQNSGQPNKNDNTKPSNISIQVSSSARPKEVIEIPSSK